MGSKSYHKAAFFGGDNGRFVLRRAGANRFFDPELEQLVGKAIRTKGEVSGNTFLMSNWNELAPTEG